MIKLSKINFEKAKSYIESQGRSLEWTLFRYYFLGGSKENILVELGKFQNEDGGFGNALEPDMRAPESSVLATTYALDLLVDLEIKPDHEMVKRTIDYLITTYNADKCVWRFTPKTTDSSPHAPWWSQGGLEETFGNFLENPRVKICGYLFQYQELTPSNLREDLLKQILKHMEKRDDKISGDTLACYLRLLKCDNLPIETKALVHQKLEKMIPVSVETDSKKWSEYCLKPYWVIKSPDSPFLNILDQALNENLDYEIRNQDNDGSWKPFWSWGDVYPDDWKIAKQEWSAILTLNLLSVLKAFGRIEK